MIYYIIGILAGLLVLTVFFLPRRKPSKQELKTLSDTDFVNGIRSLARENRMIERGGVVNLKSLVPYLERANRLMSYKVRKEMPLTEGEKWYYDNINYVKRFAFNYVPHTFARLPSTENGVRILTIARYIVQNSLEALNYDRIRLAIDTVNKEVSLTYEEIITLKSAIGYALVEFIYILSKRLMHFNNMQKLAKRRYIYKKYLKSDIYLHFALKGSIKSSIEAALEKQGILQENISLSYAKSVVETTRMARFLFDGIRNIGSLMSGEEMLSLLTINKILSSRGVYKDMSYDTRILVLSGIAAISERINISEPHIARKLINFAVYNEMDICTVLFDYKSNLVRYVKDNYYLKKVKEKKGLIREYLYILCNTLIALGLSVASYFLFFSYAAAILLFVPFLMLAQGVTNYLLQIGVNTRPLPQMAFRSVPGECVTLVAVSEYVTSADQMKQAIRNINVLRAGNPDKNIYIGLLADFKPSDSIDDPNDLALIAIAKEAEKQENLVVFVRKRTKVGKRYQAYERKRGAVMSLVRMLATGYKEDFAYISNSNLPNFEYMVALDADNTVPVGGIKEMVNIIAHPSNKKYDLISARSKYNLYSINTLFSKRFLRESSYENYPNYSSLYYNCFGKDIFCGKGIIRIKPFFNKLEGIFPENKLLSHDILEGAVVAAASGYVIYEDAPKNFVADRERKKRWQRGDIQFLPFLGRSWKNKDGHRYASEIRPIYKYLMLSNVLAILAPILLFAAGILSLIYIHLQPLFLFAALSPLLLELFGAIRNAVVRRYRWGYLFCDALSVIASYILELGLLPYYVFSNAKILATTLWKMAKKGNLLEWKTYYQSQTQGGRFAAEVVPSMLLLPIIGVGLGLGGILSLPMLVFAVISYLTNLIIYLSGLRLPQKQKHTAILNGYAEKTYNYFKYMRKPDSLIADNLQIKPYKGMSSTTSPTNLGMQIIAEISACVLGFCAEFETVQLIEQLITQIEGLKKWRGNLYNWYNTEDKSVSIEFVSSVDSGNFVAALITARGFINEKKDRGLLASRIDRLIRDTDLDALYDHNKKQFYIGYNGKARIYEGHYDLLASESRLLSLICAVQNDGENWQALLRDYSPYMGNTLYSWSGTAFEYLMTDIFVLPPKHSLLYTSSRNSVRIQKQHKTYGLFGLSESGYYAFDDALRYQYKAFGIESIALGRDKEKRVISPYSSFLALHYSPDCVVKNLKRLEQKGVLSDYGFYEAYDLEGKPRLLHSYMTHHQGMSLAAMCNYLSNGALRHYFAKDYTVAAASLLLTESREKRSNYYRLTQKQSKIVQNKLEYYINTDKIEHSTLGFGLTDGAICSYFDARGGGYTMYNQRLLNRFRAGVNEPSGRHFYVKSLGKLASPTYITMGGDPQDYSFSYTPINTSYFNMRYNVKLDIAIENNLGAEICKLTFAKERDTQIAFYEPLALASYGAANAHPVFNNFFVEAYFDKDNNAIIAKRRTKQGEPPMYAAYVARGFAELTACCDRFVFIGRGRSERNPLIFDTDSAAVGEKSIEPCAAFIGSPLGDCVEIIKLASDSLDGLMKKISDLPDNYYNFAIEVADNIKLNALTNRLLFPLISLPYPNDVLAEIDISGVADRFLHLTDRRKLITYEFEDANNSLDSLKTLITAIEELRYFGLRPSLIVVMSEDTEGVYTANVERYVQSRLHGAAVMSRADYDRFLANRAFMTLDRSLACPDTFAVLQQHNNYIVSDKKSIIDENYYIKTGNGGFVDKNGGFLYELPMVAPTSLPYANVICGEFGGVVTTENGGGFIYFGNSHENCVLKFYNDPVKDTPFERVSIATEKGMYRINGGSGTTDKMQISMGKTAYLSSFEQFDAICEAYIIDRGAIKITEVSVHSEDKQHRLKFVYSFEGVLGTAANSPYIFCDIINKTTLRMKNLLNNQEVYIALFCNNLECTEIDIRAASATVVLSCTLYPNGKPIFVAVGLKDALLNLNPADIINKKHQAISYFEGLNNITIATQDKSLDMLFNNCLLYQVISSRLNGKCGYYQAGGATGFRDQLQDTLALMQNDPLRVKKQILYHAGRQYKEGDVMHWWHHPYFGLRSKISDDKLFLPYITAEYISVTGDKSILDEVVPYIESPELGETEHNRYEAARVSDEQGTIMQHCLRAIKSCLKYGEHSLLLLGTGDWNDGLDYIGEKGRAESVMLSIFAYETMQKFAEFCLPQIKTELISIAERLRQAVENFGYDGWQYMRLFGDDGKWYGSSKSPCFTVDLVSQAMAINSGLAEPARVPFALNAARRLVDKKSGIIKLLEPPLTSDNYLGYISAYPAGVRENGGQYTHAAIWYIMALLKTDNISEAYDMLAMINPIEKCRDRLVNAAYKGEPYVLAGDVYAGIYAGRMGWSWYTGSASWMYKLILEELFGVKRRNKRLYILPKLPAGLSNAKMQYKWENGQIQITFIKTGKYKLLVDGLARHEKDYVDLDGNASSVTVEY